MENRDEDIVRCLRCFTCMAERAATSTRRCTVNPLIGRELEGDEIQPAPVKKKVLVAGGGIGVPPMVGCAQYTAGKSTAIVGFRSQEKAILTDRLEQETAKLMVATDDGSLGYHGFVDALVR